MLSVIEFGMTGRLARWADWKCLSKMACLNALGLSDLWIGAGAAAIGLSFEGNADNQRFMD